MAHVRALILKLHTIHPLLLLTPVVQTDVCSFLSTALTGVSRCITGNVRAGSTALDVNLVALTAPAYQNLAVSATLFMVVSVQKGRRWC
jgi:hypothetical protein